MWSSSLGLDVNEGSDEVHEVGFLSPEQVHVRVGGSSGSMPTPFRKGVVTTVECGI